MAAQFYGSITALITPFQNGGVDWAAFEKFVEWQIQQGSHGVVPSGTTGESPTLDYDETKRIFELCVQTVKASGKNLPVIAGTGSNSTREAIELGLIGQKAGADALLTVTPYYNKPTQDGLYAHFKAVHDSTDLPIILYNVPGRTIVEIGVETVLRLAELPRIAGIKDATSDISRTNQIRNNVKDDFSILSGEDGLAGGYLGQGADGVISVVSNCAPALSAELQNAWIERDIARFIEVQQLLAPLNKALFCESNPSPVKYACARLGLCSDEVRSPLLPASPNARKLVDAAMDYAGIAGQAQARMRASA